MSTDPRTGSFEKPSRHLGWWDWLQGPNLIWFVPAPVSQRCCSTRSSGRVKYSATANHRYRCNFWVLNCVIGCCHSKPWMLVQGSCHQTAGWRFWLAQLHCRPQYCYCISCLEHSYFVSVHRRLDNEWSMLAASLFNLRRQSRWNFASCSQV